MTISVEAWSSWAPAEELTEKPKLPFFKNVMKRRMSQLSRMVAQVGHDIDEMTSGEVVDIVFASNRGEIGRQLDITNRLLSDGEVSPSEFGYSVFNAPAALLSLIEQKKGSARALCAGKESFFRVLAQAVLQLSSGRAERILFIYAEELVPEIYSEISDISREPQVLGFLLSTDAVAKNPLLGIELMAESGKSDSTSAFKSMTKWLDSDKENEELFSSNGCSLRIFKKG